MGLDRRSVLFGSVLAGAMVEARGIKAWKDSAKTQGDGHPERIGALFRRTFAIWEREWSGDAGKRLVRVCAVRGVWFDASRRTAQWCLDNGGVDAIPPAAYIGPHEAMYQKSADKGAALRPEIVIDDMEEVLQTLHEDSGIA